MSKGRRDREHDRNPGWTAAADQAEAQAAEVSAWARSAFRLAAIGEAATTGRPPEAINEGSGFPRGPLGEIVASVTARAAAGELTVCQHGAAALSPGPPPPQRVDALIWLSWHPDLLSCAECTILLPSATGDDDRRCDGCGYVTRPGEQLQVGVDVTRADPGAAARLGHPSPALVCYYGLCQQCHHASTYAPTKQDPWPPEGL